MSTNRLESNFLPRLSDAMALYLKFLEDDCSTDLVQQAVLKSRSGLDVLVNPMGSDPNLKRITDEDIKRVAALPTVIFPAIHSYRSIDSNFDGLSTRNPTICNVKGFEGLARFYDAKKQIIRQPFGILGELFRAGRLADLDLEMVYATCALGTICNEYRELLCCGKIHVSSNLSNELFETRNFHYSVLDQITAAEFDPHFYIAEVLEDVHLKSSDSVEGIRELTRNGVRISVDDFGRKNSENTFHGLIEEGVSVWQVKFDGEFSSSILDGNVRKECERLLNLAKESGVQSVVWEGRWQGILFQNIKAIRTMHAKFDFEDVMFEGVSVDEEYNDGEADVSIDTAKFEDDDLPDLASTTDTFLAALTDDEMAVFVDTEMDKN